jgi:hypothetical protein
MKRKRSPQEQNKLNIGSYYLANVGESVAIVKLLDLDEDGRKLNVQFFKSAPFAKGLFRSWGEPEAIEATEIQNIRLKEPSLPRRSTGAVVIFKDLPDMNIR